MIKKHLVTAYMQVNGSDQQLPGSYKQINGSHQCSIKGKQKDQTNMKKNPSNVRKPTSGSNCGINRQGNNINFPVDLNQQIRRRQQSAMLKILMMMIATFLVCYAPACIMISEIFRDFQFVLTIMSSAINPFIYAWRFPKFRKGLLALFGRRRQVSQKGLQPPK